MQDLRELIAGDRLGQKAIHSCGEAEIPIRGKRVGGEGINGRRIAAAAQLPGGGQPIHDGHLHVHQDKIEPVATEHVERLTPIGRQRHHCTEALQQPPGDLPVDGVVLDHKHPSPGRL